jgi:Arc/MetJ-type ribon-helix-helix transcriptional regulator
MCCVEEELFIRIITVNLPQSYLKAIDALVGQDGLYPSRSELIRVAVRDFLIHELESAKSFQIFQEGQTFTSTSPQAIDDDLFVNVPVREDSAEGVTEYKTYRLIKR